VKEAIVVTQTKTLYEQDFNLWIEETVNLLKTDIPQVAATHRVINLNYSIHGVLKQINAI
jgi:hypothetical protein